MNGEKVSLECVYLWTVDIFKRHYVFRIGSVIAMIVFVETDTSKPPDS